MLKIDSTDYTIKWNYQYIYPGVTTGIEYK
jgi:hypothetical protein